MAFDGSVRVLVSERTRQSGGRECELVSACRGVSE